MPHQALPERVPEARRLKEICPANQSDAPGGRVAVQWLTTLRGKEVVFTGVNEGYEEEDLAQLCRDLGARRVSDDLNKTTNVLVRGYSPHWKHGTYGNKEAKVAKNQAAGLDVVIIDFRACWRYVMEGQHGHCNLMWRRQQSRMSLRLR